MKTDTQRYNRAATEITERLRKFIADIRPALQGKHQLSGQDLDLAITKGVGVFSIECAATADLPLDALVNQTDQRAGQTVGAC